MVFLLQSNGKKTYIRVNFTFFLISLKFKESPFGLCPCHQTLCFKLVLLEARLCTIMSVMTPAPCFPNPSFMCLRVLLPLGDKKVP